MKQIVFWKGLTFIACCLAYFSCRQTPLTAAATYTYIKPSYSDIKLLPQADTLHFLLGERTYNAIKSFNYFKHNGAAFISFYDRGSKSINIYNFLSENLVNRIPLRKWVNSSKLDKASVYIKNFDSIFVTTNKALYLLDSTGAVKKRIDFPNDPDKLGYFSNTTPAVINGNLLYIGIKPFIDEKSLKAHKEWRVLYGIDIQHGSKKRYYSLPDIYQKNLYGYAFLEYSYCFNARGHFVFSFAADTNIYETDLNDYHIAYYGKSRFQNASILPVTKEDLRREDSFKFYSLRDSYGPIFFDPYKKRYLREAKQKKGEAEYLANTSGKKRSIIIFNEDFKIIGESEINGDFSLSSVFFTPDGRIYTRVKISDEHALHFVRLAYQEAQENPVKLAQH
jgi:hypothetical protein